MKRLVIAAALAVASLGAHAATPVFITIFDPDVVAGVNGLLAVVLVVVALGVALYAVSFAAALVIGWPWLLLRAIRAASREKEAISHGVRVAYATLACILLFIGVMVICAGGLK